MEVFAGSILYSLLMSLATGDEIIIAMVLFAVAISVKNVKAQIPSIPPLLVWKTFFMWLNIALNPPFSLINAHIDETRIVTIIVSNIWDVPDFIELKMDINERLPVIAPAILNRMIPVPNTTKTLIDSNDIAKTIR